MATGVLLFYGWITLLHCVFVGMCVYMVAGHRLARAAWIVPTLVCTALLAAIETYWIPFVGSAGASLTVAHPQLLEAYGLRTDANIIPLLSPGPLSAVVWLAQGIAANFIGRWAYRRALRKVSKPSST